MVVLEFSGSVREISISRPTIVTEEASMAMFRRFPRDLSAKPLIWGSSTKAASAPSAIRICGLSTPRLVLGDLGKFVLLSGVSKTMNRLWTYLTLLFKMFRCGETGLARFGEALTAPSLSSDLPVIPKESSVTSRLSLCRLLLWSSRGCSRAFLSTTADDSSMALSPSSGTGRVRLALCFPFISKSLLDLSVLGSIITNPSATPFTLTFSHTWKIQNNSV